MKKLFKVIIFIVIFAASAANVLACYKPIIEDPIEQQPRVECTQNCTPTFQGSTTEAPVCNDTVPTKTGANFHILRKGPDAIAKWVPTGGSKVKIYYSNIDDITDNHSLIDVENDGYEDNLHLLGSKNWRFGLQQVNGCAAGPIVWVDDADTSDWVLFR